MTIIDTLPPRQLEEELRGHLQQGRLPDLFLYANDGGAAGWLDLDRSSQFPIASDLTMLLERSARALADRVPAGATLVGLGVGSGRKERILLEALADRCRRYLAVDVNRSLLDEALSAVADLPVEAVGLTGRVEDLGAILAHAQPPVLLCLLGNTFSNFEPDELLSIVMNHLSQDDLFLFDAHLAPLAPGRLDAWRQSVEHSYGSAMNARFNLGPLLHRGVEASACRFGLRLAQQPTRLGPAWRTTKTLDILQDCQVRLGEDSVPLPAGSRLQMGFTYKHTRPQVLAWLRDARLRVVDAFSSELQEDLLVLTQLTQRRET